MKLINIVLISSVAFSACSQNAPKNALTHEGIVLDTIVNVVGEIFFDDSLDDPAFTICNDQAMILQYYAFGEKAYEGEKAAIETSFFDKYQSVNVEESGLIRIRFIVNCRGEAGRFRVLSMDTNYEKYDFDSRIVDQLLAITKDLSGWKKMESRGIKRDYYQYLILKIENGALKEIMP